MTTRKNFAWLDLQDFGAKFDGTDDQGAWQAAVDKICTDGVSGVLVVPPLARSVVGSTIVFDPSINGITVIGFGAEIEFTGTGPLFECSTPGSQPTQRRLRFIGGRYYGNPGAESCWKLNDCGGAQFSELEVDNWPDKGVWNIRNVSAWSENLSFSRIRAAGCDRVATYEPASVTGGAGTASFARQRWNDIFVSGGSDYWFLLDGGVYDSQFDMVSGNIPSTATALFRAPAAGGGTRLSNINVESPGGLGTVAIIDPHPAGGMVALSQFDARDGLRPVTDNTSNVLAHRAAGGYVVVDNDDTIVHQFRRDGIGFFGSADGPQLTVNTSRASGAALQQLLGNLDMYGLIVDNSTP